ncbi:MAG: ChaN family lipoprotein [Desulfuromonadales bacterium]
MSQQPMIGNPEAPYPPAEEPSVGDIYHLPTGVKVTADQMIAAITDARIVYVGETHDNPAAHRLQLLILKAMAERYPEQLSLGMEMFNTSQQNILDQWSRGELSEKDFLKKSGWYDNWRMDYAYYRDILNYAREHQIPLLGLNATREMVEAVGKSTLPELDDELRSQLPEFDLEDPYQLAVARAIYAGHLQSDKMLDGFLRIQTLWDETMAENIVRTLADRPEHRMLVMAGGNHIRNGFGIPRRVYRRLPTSYVLVGSRELVVPEEKQDQMMDVDPPHMPMPPYDYLVYTEYESLPGERVKLGVRMHEENGKVVVAAVVPNSTADEAGVLAGDVITALDDVLIDDSFDLIYEVSQRASGDQATLAVERDGEQLQLEVMFTPLPKTDSHGTDGGHKK